MTRRLRDADWVDAVLWVVPTNTRARRLYESAGWVPDGNERSEVLGSVGVEMRYACQLGAPELAELRRRHHCVDGAEQTSSTLENGRSELIGQNRRVGRVDEKC